MFGCELYQADLTHHGVHEFPQARFASHSIMKVRKGTRCCSECKIYAAASAYIPRQPVADLSIGRRRKTRCDFKSSAIICSACRIRGVSCIPQEDMQIDRRLLDKRETLREKVTRLEAFLDAQVARPPTAAPSPSTVNTVREGQPVNVLKWPTPVLSLFANDVLTSNRGSDGVVMTGEANGSHAPSSHGGLQAGGSHNKKSARIAESLLSLIPSQQDLDKILQSGGGWWVSWREMYPGICSSGKHATLAQYISYAVSQDDAVLAANALICVAISLQLIPPTFDYTSLSFTKGRTATIYDFVAAVDGLVTPDDTLMSSLEGIETILLQSKLYINFGQARKAWLLNRRGFSFCDLLGLHANEKTSKGPVSASTGRRDSILSHLIEVDCQLSLILGLPPMISRTGDNASHNKMRIQGRDLSNGLYRRRLFGIAAAIVDRNARDPNPSLATNSNIEHELDDLSELMSDDWWDISSIMSHTPEMGDICDRLFTQFWHHQMKASLHLPFMLRSATKPRYLNNREACLMSSRKMLEIYHMVRQCNCTRFLHYCQVMDFQAFTAAVILILGLCGYHGVDQMQDSDRRWYDWELVDLATETLGKAAAEVENTVAKQSHQALQVIRAARQTEISEKSQFKNGANITVPYFGTIFIAAGKTYPRSRNAAPDLLASASPILSTSYSEFDAEVPFIGFNSFAPYLVNDYSSDSIGLSDASVSTWQTPVNADLNEQWHGLPDGLAMPGT